MDHRLPFLEVSGPDGVHERYSLRAGRVTIGRFPDYNNLRPQAHRLIRHMDGRNRESGYTAVMCSFAELIDALWGDAGYDHAERDAARVVWGLRQKSEPAGDEPQVLQTVRRLGYRLVTRPRARER